MPEIEVGIGISSQDEHESSSVFTCVQGPAGAPPRGHVPSSRPRSVKLGVHRYGRLSGGL
jgi:hypothetical protein